jgi:abequosyltransferase
VKEVRPCLSLCIATRNRATVLKRTLKGIVDEISGLDIEVVVVDGNSTDETSAVMADVSSRYSFVKYFRESHNSGVDGDYDKSVGYANGVYCWLLSDDDKIESGAAARVIDACHQARTLVVVNARVYDQSFQRVLQDRRLPIAEDLVFERGADEALFVRTADYLTFIGGVVIRREEWLGRNRTPYQGSMFVHVGVIFQAELPNGAVVIAEPAVGIRYGAASWVSRRFEIWLTLWPRLVWSFDRFSPESRAAVVAREPWRRLGTLLFYRAMASYSVREYGAIVRPQISSWIKRIGGWLIAKLPVVVARAVATKYIRWRYPYDEITPLDLQPPQRSSRSGS